MKIFPNDCGVLFSVCVRVWWCDMNVIFFFLTLTSNMKPDQTKWSRNVTNIIYSKNVRFFWCLSKFVHAKNYKYFHFSHTRITGHSIGNESAIRKIRKPWKQRLRSQLFRIYILFIFNLEEIKLNHLATFHEKNGFNDHENEPNKAKTLNNIRSTRIVVSAHFPRKLIKP